MTPRKVDPNQHLMSSLGGSWLGTMEIYNGSTLVSRDEASLEFEMFPDGSETRFRWNYQFSGVPDVLAVGRAALSQSGDITISCVYQKISVGSYFGGRFLQIRLLDNSCQNRHQENMKLEVLENGQLSVMAYDGTYTYRGQFTAW